MFHRPSKQWVPMIMAGALTVGMVPAGGTAQGIMSEEIAVVEYDYLVLSQPVSAFLNGLSRDSGVRIAASQGVRGRIIDRRLTGSISDILDDIAAGMDLDWFRFNDIYYVSGRSEATARMTRLGDLDSEDALSALEAAGLLMDRYSVSVTAEGSAIALAGPPQYLAFAESVIEAIPSEIIEPREIEERSVVVRRGIEEERVPIE